PVILANARMLGMSERQLFAHVYWPSALSWMFSSLHTSVGFAIIGAVVGEYLGSAAGLGYLINQAEGTFDTTGVFAGMAILALFVLVIDGLVTLVEKRLLLWRPPAAAGQAWTMRVGGKRIHVLRVFALAGAAMLAASAAQAQAPEKKDINLGVGGAAALYYLPLALTDRLGYFKEQGLNVEISDFKGGSQSLTALVGGSVDVVTGAFEHTLRMQAKGQDIIAAIELGRYPGIALAVRKERADRLNTLAD